MINKNKNPLILNTKYLILGAVLIFSYFLSRLINLTIIPMFADEAIYIRWAQVMRAVASLRFLPLSDGKQPLFMWLVIPFLKIFANPLVAGRMVSVIAGLGTMAGVGALSYSLFKKKEISLFAMILYLISPFTFFFDRMALVDGLLSFFWIWFLVLTVLLVNHRRLDLAMIAGIILGLGLLTKSPALFLVLLLPLTLVSARRRLVLRQAQDKLQGVALLIFYWLVIYLFGFAIYNILRLGPEFHMIAIRNKDYVFPIAEVLKHPFDPLIGHLKDTVTWYWILGTPLIFLSGIAGMYLSVKRNLKQGLFLFLWFLLPILGQGAVAKVYTARYVLFTVPIFLIFSAVAAEKFFTNVRSKILVVLGLALIFFFPFYQIFLLIADPQRAWLPENERKGYFELWTSGYGIKESSEYIKEVAKNQKTLVGTEGYFGTLPDGLQIYLEKVPNVTVIGVGYPIKEVPEKLKNGLVDSKVFLLVNDSRFEAKNLSNFNLIKKFPKAENPKTGLRENLLLFEILK